jgi:hypothetical protein
MLNGSAYLGLSRAAELFSKIDPDESQRLQAEAESFKEDIRAAYFEELARGPVVPLGDGTWRPTAPPWVGQRGRAVFVRMENYVGRTAPWSSETTFWDPFILSFRK